MPRPAAALRLDRVATVTQTIGPASGTVAISAADGTAYSLTVAGQGAAPRDRDPAGKDDWVWSDQVDSLVQLIRGELRLATCRRWVLECS